MNTDLQSKLDSCRALIQDRLEHLITREDPRSLYDPMRYALAQPGKQLRPALLLLSCEAVGAKSEQAVDAALAIEIIHNFTLVHDDIMDHDELRRGRQTVYRRWDENVAILAGDALLVMGFGLLANLRSSDLPQLLQRFSTAILEICEGQSLDKEFEQREAITLAEYYGMIERKTGRLFELACWAGALLGGGNANQIEALGRYGADLGRAFQLQDDLLDLLGDQQTIGKDVGSDLEEDKKTFLIAHARSAATAAQWQMLLALSAAKPIDAARRQAIIALFAEIGTLAAAQEEISRSLASARAALQLLPPNSATTALEHFLDTLVQRTF